MTSTGTRKLRLIALLAAGHSYDSCAKQLQMSKRTIVRLNADAEFSAEVRQARSLLFAETVGLLAAEAAATIRTLVELRDVGSEATRLGACRTILDKLSSAREQVDLEARMAALEQGLSARSSGSRFSRQSTSMMTNTIGEQP